LEEKPFVYVPVSKKEPDRKEFISHEAQKNLTGKIDFDLEVVSDYLFVGSGGYDFHGDMVFYSFFQTKGNLAIPGTSLKGSIRAVAEAISNSCVNQWAGRSGRKPREKPDEKPFIPDTHKRCESEDKLCPVCRIFGMTGYGGRISFSDANPLGKIKSYIVKIGELFEPKIVRTDEDGKGKRKFYGNWRFNPINNLNPEKNHRFVEAVSKGTHFRFTFSFNNLLEEELSLILHAIGVDQDYRIKIGGAKPRCFGTVKSNPLVGSLYKNPIENPTKITEHSIKDFMKNKKLINPELLKFLSEQLRSREDKICPKGGY
jgi:CRISPR/Cas system CSM-associated protein Csm3 (group 7 of RAMP superfamily)